MKRTAHQNGEEDIVVVNRTRQPLPLAFFGLVARAALATFGVPRASVGVVFVGERAMRRLAQHRHRSRKTPNVLSFSYEHASSGKRRGTIVGDVVLCVPVARREAKRFGRTPLDHLAALLIHGMVHLWGMVHETPKEAARMEAIEQRILRKARRSNR